MVTIRDNGVSATYTDDPYPNWDGDEALAERGEAMLHSLEVTMINKGLLDPDGGTFAQDLHDAFIGALELAEIEIVEARRPGPDPPPGLVH